MKNHHSSHRTLPQPPATFPELSGTATEPPGAAQSSLDSPPEDPPAPGRSRARRPAGLKTGPRRVLAAQSSQNHHKISSKPNRNASKASCKLPTHLWKRYRASWSLSRMFLDSPPDSGLRTPYSGLPIETRPLQEIIIKNHKPKSFSSSVEHPHKDSPWFTKSENHHCEASPQHSVASLLDNFP